jgi:hypothetical protein
LYVDSKYEVLVDSCTDVVTDEVLFIYLFIHSVIYNWGTNDFACTADTFEWSHVYIGRIEWFPDCGVWSPWGLKTSGTYLRNFAKF